MHDACCWVFEQRRGLFAADEAYCSASTCSAWQRGEQRLSAGRQAPQRRRRRRARREGTVAQFERHGERGVRQQGGRGNAARARRAAPQLARVSRRAALSVFPEQRDARGDAAPHGRPRFRRSVAVDDVAVESGGALPAAALVHALRRRGRVQGDTDVAACAASGCTTRRSAGSAGGRRGAWSRAAPRPSCRSTARWCSLP